MAFVGQYFSLCSAIFLISLDSGRCAPSKPREAGPCIGMDCLHGVLMHGDDKMGKAHVHTEEKVVKGTDHVKTIDEHMHGVLMHADKEPGKDHSDDHALDKKIDETVRKHEESQMKVGVKNPHDLIHEKNELKPEVRDFKEFSENRLISWFASLWRGIFSLFVQTEEEEKPVHDILDDMSLVGNSGPLKDHHNHPDEHPQEKRKKNKRRIHTEN